MSKCCPWGCKKGSKIRDYTLFDDTVSRRRECNGCGRKWTTWEVDHNTANKITKIKAILNVTPNEATEPTRGSEPGLYSSGEVRQGADGFHSSTRVRLDGKFS